MKKIINSRTFYALLIIGAVTVSCNRIDEFGDLNQNPGGSTDPIPSGLLTQVLSAMGDDYVLDVNRPSIATISGLYCQYYSETQYTEASRYARQQMNFDRYYAGLNYLLASGGPVYSSANLNDLQGIINFSTNPETAAQALAYGSINNQIAVARILKAYIFWFLTDNFGDIPYSQALNGNFGINPYDRQQDIYNSLFTELSEAVAQFDDGEPAQGDILFNGDIGMWKKFANSIHAIMALRISKVDAAKGKAEFSAAVNDAAGVFEDGENAELEYPGGYFANPVYNYYNVTLRDDYAISSTLMDWLNDTGDPRVDAYGSSTVGFPYGLTRDDAVSYANSHSDFARLLQWYSTPATKPMPLLTAGEVFLARAEAAALGWISDDAGSMYSAGIENSWRYWGVFDQGDFDDYMANSDIALTGSGDISKIATQEWISHYPNGSMGYADWRRTGYPDLDPAPGQNNPIPLRFAYGTNEESYNPQFEAEAAKRYVGPEGPNSQFVAVWWDK